MCFVSPLSNLGEVLGSVRAVAISKLSASSLEIIIMAVEIENNKTIVNASLKAPFTWIVSGPSGSGKTSHVAKALLGFVNPVPTKIYWHYGIWTKYYEELSTQLPIEFVKGLPGANFINTIDRSESNVLVIDDLMHEVSQQTRLISPLFTRGSHHANLSVILVVQNLFAKNLQELRMNTNYLTLFANPVDYGSIKNIARQIAPGRASTESFLAVFKDVTNSPYGYLFIDFRSDLRYRTNIFGEHQILYTF